MKAFSAKVALACFWALVIGLLPMRMVAQTIYGVTFFDNQLISIDPTTGAGTLVGLLGPNTLPYGIAGRFGSLYTFSPTTNRIQQINPFTGATSPGINIGVSGLSGEGDLAFRSDGIGFLSSAFSNATLNPTNNLYRFDITTGTSSIIGNTGTITFDGLAFSPTGVLYGISQPEVDANLNSISSLYVINQSNAALTLVGNLSIPVGSPVSGLTFAPNGTLYAALDDRLTIINPLNASVTDVNPGNLLGTGFGSVSGIVVVPEPGSIGLLAGLAVTGAGFAFSRRRKRRK